MSKEKKIINRLDIPGQRPKVLKLDPEIQKLLTPLTREEYNLLEQNILAEGCQQPLFLWLNSGIGNILEDIILLDGYHRYEICHRHTIWFPTTGQDFASREKAIAWVKKNQLGRRNLTEEAKRHLRGSLYQQDKKQGERNDLTLGNSYPKLDQEKNNFDNLKQILTLGHNDPRLNNDSERNNKMRTSEKLAKEFGVSEKTIRNDVKFAEALDDLTEKHGQEIKDKILSGKAKVPIKKIVEIARMELEEQKKEVQNILTDHPAEKKFIPAIVPKQEIREPLKEESQEESQEMITMPKDLKAISEMLLANFGIEELKQLVKMILKKVD